MGNKAELEDEREVTKEEAMKLVKDYELDYFIEASSKTGMNVEKIFVDAAKLLYKDYLKSKSNDRNNDYHKDGSNSKNIIELKKKDENSQNCIGSKKKTIKKVIKVIKPCIINHKI